LKSPKDIINSKNKKYFSAKALVILLTGAFLYLIRNTEHPSAFIRRKLNKNERKIIVILRNEAFGYPACSSRQ